MEPQTDGAMDATRDAPCEAGIDGAFERPTIELPIRLCPVLFEGGTGGAPLKASSPKRVPEEAGAR